jgi:hypothetical protein
MSQRCLHAGATGREAGGAATTEQATTKRALLLAFLVGNCFQFNTIHKDAPLSSLLFVLRISLFEW